MGGVGTANSRAALSDDRLYSRYKHHYTYIYRNGIGLKLSLEQIVLLCYRLALLLIQSTNLLIYYYNTILIYK